MLHIEQFVNELMTSNGYVVYLEGQHSCLVIDPGSEKCVDMIRFLEEKDLHPEYILLTHEHTDHTWGVNTLTDRYDARVACSADCKKALPREGRTYFLFYRDDTEYEYAVKRVDLVLEKPDGFLEWKGGTIRYLLTPGHSKGSVCYSIENQLFTGDTVMQFKPYIHKKQGSLEEFKKSVRMLLDTFDGAVTNVCPGHGEQFLLKDYKYEG